MKICVVTFPSFLAPNRATYNMFTKAGHDVKLIIPATKSRILANEIDDPAFEDEDIVVLEATSFKRMGYVKGLIKEVNRFAPDVIHYDGEPDSLVSFLLSRYAGKNKLIYTCQTYENISYAIGGVKRGSLSFFVKEGMCSAFRKLSCKNINHIFACSKESKEIVESRGFQGKVSVMPLGFDSNYFYVDEQERQASREELGLKECVIAYFGRPLEGKGIHLLLDALIDLVDNQFHFMMDKFDEYGGSEYLNLIREKINMSILSERVTYIKARHGEVASRMRAADIIVVPSLITSTFKEQYGRVVAEAMACGAIVIVTDSGALPEILNDSNFVVKAGDKNELKRKIEWSMNNIEKLGEVRSRNAQYAQSYLSDKAQSKAMLQVYNKF